jgi:hypothetical protein
MNYLIGRSILASESHSQGSNGSFKSMVHKTLLAKNSFGRVKSFRSSQSFHSDVETAHIIEGDLTDDDLLYSETYARNSTKITDSKTITLEDRLMNTSPLFEAFGNAKSNYYIS